MYHLKPVQRALLGAALLVVAVGSILFLQKVFARPDMQGFDPDKMARLESGMWRSYYEGHWVKLARQTMELACGQYGFSWWDGARISLHAARSAMFFRKNTHDPRCAPELEKYYAIIQRAVAGKFDVHEAARLELEWWKERRCKVPPQEYARTIAKLIAVTYEVPEEFALPGATMRAGAMAYRDARHGKMTAADWDEVTRQLSGAYTLFKTPIAKAR